MIDSVCTGENCDLKLICQRYIDYQYCIETGQQNVAAVITKSSKPCKVYKHKAFYGE